MNRYSVILFPSYPFLEKIENPPIEHRQKNGMQQA
jgi:hypothetical protein